eukprot:m.54095 g.54095  ORF g.54095 m.54095 type:complete len:64 (-) comp11072_c0_seq3:408-599(-)
MRAVIERILKTFKCFVNSLLLKIENTNLVKRIRSLLVYAIKHEGAETKCQSNTTRQQQQYDRK